MSDGIACCAQQRGCSEPAQNLTQHGFHGTEGFESAFPLPNLLQRLEKQCPKCVLPPSSGGNFPAVCRARSVLCFVVVLPSHAIPTASLHDINVGDFRLGDVLNHMEVFPRLKL